jgi:hypothetical protein
VTQEELPPSVPGCRSIATTTCHHHPVVVPKKVAYEECRQVPTVDCYLVLKTVPDLECSPETYEDCTDVAKQARDLHQLNFFYHTRFPIWIRRRNARRCRTMSAPT